MTETSDAVDVAAALIALGDPDVILSTPLGDGGYMDASCTSRQPVGCRCQTMSV